MSVLRTAGRRVARIAAAGTTLGATLLTSALAYAPAAEAAGGYQFSQASIWLDAYGFGRQTALCPAGMVAVGGGLESTVARHNDIAESAPITQDGKSGWLASSRNASGNSGEQVIVRTGCMVTPAGYEIVRQDVAVPGQAVLRGMVLCPAGKVVLSGGAMVDGSGNGDTYTRLQESAPGTRAGQPGWLNAVRNEGATTRTVKTFAVCAAPLPGYAVHSVSGTVDAKDHETRAVDCAWGQRVLGGGMQTVGTGTQATGVTLGSTFVDPYYYWEVTMRNRSSANRPYLAFAICADA